jgi:glycosyltransferase involved in cell wall biosynthesis
MYWKEALRRIRFRLNGRVIHLKPEGEPKGNVLISYMPLPWLDTRKIVLDAHTNRWECTEIARTFLEHGYTVDVIDFENASFIPKKKYDYFLDVGKNMERLAPLLGSECVKIFHGTTGYWRFFVDASEKRLASIQERRGVRLPSGRPAPSGDSIRYADVAIMLGSDSTIETYPPELRGKMSRIHVSTTHMFPSPSQKDFDRARRNFIWFGGAGLAHKGVDLVLEAFSTMPEYTLTLIGKISPNDPFVDVYKKEMYSLPNIKTLGWLDPGSAEFKEICTRTLGVVYPSCSEGCAGSVVLCMHAGLIPIVSRETGVETNNFGVTLRENSIQAIRDTVKNLANEDVLILNTRAMDTWNYARTHHTRERFATTFREFISNLEKK